MEAYYFPQEQVLSDYYGVFGMTGVFLLVIVFLIIIEKRKK